MSNSPLAIRATMDGSTHGHRERTLLAESEGSGREIPERGTGGVGNWLSPEASDNVVVVV